MDGWNAESHQTHFSLDGEKFGPLTLNPREFGPLAAKQANLLHDNKSPDFSVREGGRYFISTGYLIVDVAYRGCKRGMM
jgi:hypothetical protein